MRGGADFLSRKSKCQKLTFDLCESGKKKDSCPVACEKIRKDENFKNKYKQIKYHYNNIEKIIRAGTGVGLE